VGQETRSMPSLADRARRVIPGGVNSGQRLVEGLEDLVISATDGATFTDAGGRVYRDYHAAFGPPLLGHNDPDVDRAVAETATSLDLVGVGVTPVEIELAERLVDLVPSMEQVLLTATGSEATFHAIRLARTITGRKDIIKFQGCYHGWHDSVAMNVISDPGRVGKKDPLSGGILPEVLDATIVLPFNNADAVQRELEARDGQVAAVILEPIPHNIGAVLPKPGFLERLRELCTAHGTVLIFDEVITGFRHALGGYQSIAGVSPDLTTLGKAMANGYPVSALGVARTSWIFSALPPAGRPSSPAHSTAIRPWRRPRWPPSRSWSVSPCTTTSSNWGSELGLSSRSSTGAWGFRWWSTASAPCSSPTSSSPPWRAMRTCSATMSSCSLGTGESS